MVLKERVENKIFGAKMISSELFFFSRKRIMSRLFLVVLLLAVTVLSEASSIQPAHAENCASLFANQFKKDKHWKAFAENKKDNRGGYACGGSYGYSTKNEAVKYALLRCRQWEKKTQRGIKGTCRIVAVE
jgi:hypothetical protein